MFFHYVLLLTQPWAMFLLQCIILSFIGHCNTILPLNPYHHHPTKTTKRKIIIYTANKKELYKKFHMKMGKYSVRVFFIFFLQKIYNNFPTKYSLTWCSGGLGNLFGQYYLTKKLITTILPFHIGIIIYYENGVNQLSSLHTNVNVEAQRKKERKKSQIIFENFELQE